MRNPRHAHLLFALAGCVALAGRAGGGEIGPDVIVADLPGTVQYAHTTQKAALAVATTSCNVGDEFLFWVPQPSNQHPVIAQNMYRLLNDRFEQIGQAWVKHGFVAVNNGICGVCDGQVGNVLGVGCSDPYGTNINQGPILGARVDINPVTGFFVGTATNNHSGHSHSPIAHGLQVAHTDLGVAGARYFVEGHYVTADDAAAGNGNNNASYREVSVTSSGFNQWSFANLGPTVQQVPAIFAWGGATFTTIDDWPVEGRLIVASKAWELGGGQHRYEYAVYNMSSERGVRSLSLPLGGAAVSNVGSHAAPNHSEGYLDDPVNTPWVSYVDSGDLNWSSQTYAENTRANAIRWGTLHNFWLDANAPPVESIAVMQRYKPGEGGDVVLANVIGPAPGDCNHNTVADDSELAADPLLDCNGDGFLDECQLSGSDCDSSGILDECELNGATDCDANGVLDVCELAERDCNENGVVDACELTADCNENGLPDFCDALGNDCNANTVPDECENDCDHDGLIDACAGEPDCNENAIPDSCDVNGQPGGEITVPSGFLFLTFGPNDLSHSLSVTQGGAVADVNVFLDIKHPWISEVTVTLEHDGVTVVLWNQQCGAFDDIMATMDDEGGTVVCGNPTGGVITPASAGGGLLSDFDGQDPFGTWTLHIDDALPGQNHGFIRQWSLLVTADPVPPVSEDADENGVPDECETGTCAGDLNGDGRLDAGDVSDFVGAFISGDPSADVDGLPPEGGPPDMADVAYFVDMLLVGSGPCP